MSYDETLAVIRADSKRVNSAIDSIIKRNGHGQFLKVANTGIPVVRKGNYFQIVDLVDSQTKKN